jgi:hypothetical protein
LVAYPPDDPPALPVAIEHPLVPNTPAGVEELEAWRERQLVKIGISWATPVVLLVLTLLFDALGSRPLTGLAGLLTLLSGASAPGLTIVYLLRRRQARLLAEEMPQLPRASLRLAGQVAVVKEKDAGRGGRGGRGGRRSP